MKPNLPSYFLTLILILIQGLLWLGQVYYLPEVNIWVHLFLSVVGIALGSFTILILTIQSQQKPRSLPKIGLLVVLNFGGTFNSIWFFILCGKQLLQL